jgi:tripeptidyl-peptidase I
VPGHIQPHLDYITPGIKLHVSQAQPPSAEAIARRSFGFSRVKKPSPPPMKPMPKAVPAPNALGDSFCDQIATPECIADLYNITKPTLKNGNNQLGIFEDLGDYYSQNDLNEFFAALAPYIPQGTHPKLDAIDGAVVPSLTNTVDAGPESDLDFQISYPIIWPQNSVLYQTDDPVYEANYTVRRSLL